MCGNSHKCTNVEVGDSGFGWFSPPPHCVEETAQWAVACPRWCWENCSRLFQSHSGVWMSGQRQRDTITPKLSSPLLRIKSLLHLIAHDYIRLFFRKTAGCRFYELFWTSKPWFMVELARVYLQGFPLWNELVSNSLHPNWAWWLHTNETNPHHEVAQVYWNTSVFLLADGVGLLLVLHWNWKRSRAPNTPD